MKKISILLIVVMCLGLFAGCGKTGGQSGGGGQSDGSGQMSGTKTYRLEEIGYKESLYEKRIDVTYINVTVPTKEYFSTGEKIEVTSKIKANKIWKKQGGDVKRCLSLVRAKDGASYVKTDEGCFRVYNFIENTVAINMPLSAEHFGEGGACFAGFAKNLAGFDASTLTDVIPHFHDTVRRVENLEKSAKKNIAGRFSEVEELYDFVLSRKSAAGVVLAGMEKAIIPLRVTHNDTKFNNLLFDAKTKKPVSVIDLDTVMKGSMLYDFGDAVRTGCNSADEDEPDLTKVKFLSDYYAAFEKAYLGVFGDDITAEEKRLLGFSSMLMTYECGARFLTDYLDGDVYFAVQAKA